MDQDTPQRDGILRKFLRNGDAQQGQDAVTETASVTPPKISETTQKYRDGDPAEEIHHPAGETFMLPEDDRVIANTQSPSQPLLPGQPGIEIEQLLLDQNRLLAELNSNLIKLHKTIKYIAANEPPVRVTNITMSVFAMVDFMVKWIVACIPVGILLGIIYLLLSLFSYLFLDG